jgi:hypothetical protein
LSPRNTGTCIIAARAQPEAPQPARDAPRAEQPLAALRLPGDHVERRARRGHGRRGERGREHEAPRPIDDQVDEGARSGDVGAGAAERLAERPHVDVDAGGELRRFGEPRAAGAEHAGGVRLVDHDEGAVSLGDGHQLLKRRPIAVHGEHRIGDDESPPGARRGRQRPLERRRVPVGKDVDGGPGEAAAVDDARVIERIAVEVIARAHERAERTEVGLVSGGKEQGGFRALEGGETPFHARVEVGVTGDQPRGTRPAAPTVDRLACRRPERRMGGEPQVVVGREEEDAPPRDFDFAVGRGGERAQTAPESLRLEPGESARAAIEPAAAEMPGLPCQP